MSEKRTINFSVPYYLWLVLFVIAPVILLVFQSFTNLHGQFTLANYKTYFGSGT